MELIGLMLFVLEALAWAFFMGLTVAAAGIVVWGFSFGKPLPEQFGIYLFCVGTGAAGFVVLVLA